MFIFNNCKTKGKQFVPPKKKNKIKNNGHYKGDKIFINNIQANTINIKSQILNILFFKIY